MDVTTLNIALTARKYRLFFIFLIYW